MKQHLVCHLFQLVLLNILLTSCAVPNAAQHQQDVNHLPKVFSTLQNLKVKAYRNQDWCKNIAYARGGFSSNLKASTCNLFTEKPIAIDDRAQQDFQAITSSMATTGGNIHFLSAAYDRADRLIRAKFNLSTACRCAYVYQPRYSRLPENIEGKMEFTAINSDWFFVWED
jgi:hypothetical protein